MLDKSWVYIREDCFVNFVLSCRKDLFHLWEYAKGIVLNVLDSLFGDFSVQIELGWGTFVRNVVDINIRHESNHLGYQDLVSIDLRVCILLVSGDDSIAYKEDTQKVSRGS